MLIACLQTLFSSNVRCIMKYQHNNLHSDCLRICYQTFTIDQGAQNETELDDPEWGNDRFTPKM